MDQDRAQATAQQWWGEKGKALFIPYTNIFSVAPNRAGRLEGRYVVGLTVLPARLGGRLATQLGTSRLSFEAAFADAHSLGHGPTTGLEGDEAIEDEA